MFVNFHPNFPLVNTQYKIQQTDASAAKVYTTKGILKKKTNN